MPLPSAIRTAALTIPIPGELEPLRLRHARTAGAGLPGADRRGGPRADSRCATTDIRARSRSCSTWSNTALGITLDSADVIGAYAGLRPLIDTGAGRTADVSRDHAVVESPSGVISVIGGKLTEYRHMAEDVLDRAIELRGLDCRRVPDPKPAVGRCAGESGLDVRADGGLAGVAGAALRGRGGQRDRCRDAASGRPTRWPTGST